jgi:hypothetical protein
MSDRIGASPMTNLHAFGDEAGLVKDVVSASDPCGVQRLSMIAIKNASGDFSAFCDDPTSCEFRVDDLRGLTNCHLRSHQ